MMHDCCWKAFKHGEMWEYVPEYESLYMVSNAGKVKNIKTNKELKQHIKHNGYYDVRLNKNGKSTNFKTHRLVAMAFIPNPENKSQVNHINGIKTDNRVENLEWVTASENAKHSFYTLKHKIKPVKCLETGIIYPSVREAERKTGILATCICAYIKKRPLKYKKYPDKVYYRTSAGGYHWEFCEETVNNRF